MKLPMRSGLFAKAAGVMILLHPALTGCSRSNAPPKDSPKLELPAVASGKPHCSDSAPTISVDERYVWLQGQIVAPIVVLAEAAKVDRFEPLIKQLEGFTKDWREAHPTQEFAGAVAIEADAATDRRLLRKVLFAAHQAHFEDYCLGVRGNGGAKVFLRAHHPPALPSLDSVMKGTAVEDVFIVIQDGGYDVRAGKGVPSEVGSIGDEKYLRDGLTQWRQQHPSRNDVHVVADDGTTYVMLVTAIGAALAANLTQVFIDPQ